MKISNVISGVASTLFVAAILTLGLSAGIPSAAEAQTEPRCKGKKADRDDECIDNPGGHVHVPSVATHEAAVGHKFDKFVCLVEGNASGAIFDRGTSHDGTLVCELLQCGVGGSGDVGCSSNFEDDPQPLIDISGLFDLWNGTDPKSQGEPKECFGDDGIIEPGVSVATGRAGEINVQLFFRDAVATTNTSGGRCGDATEEINYEVFIGPCALMGGANFPPVPNGDAIIICDSSTEATVIHTGGGGFAAKCGYHATGTLGKDTKIHIKVKEDE